MKIDNDILKRYAEGKCSSREKALVEQWFDQYQREGAGEVSGEKFLERLTSLDRRIHGVKVRSLSYWKWGAAAAVLLVGMLTMLKFNFFRSEEVQFFALEEIKAPLSSNAIVVLEDDTEYSLDSIRVGDTLSAKGYLITKLATGELHYITHAGDTDAVVYNTLRTKSGGIAFVKLSDGSLVWLNANSELVYPIDFKGKEREVQLKGEGYFEVAKVNTDAGQREPFYVRGDEQSIKVLGTRFNANFTDEHITALLEGHVAIADEGTSVGGPKDIQYATQLKANQLYQHGKVRTVDHIEKYIDWKEGYFDLNGLTLYDLATKLSNWYGVEITVDSGLEGHRLFGGINRNKDLKELLELVAQTSPIEFYLKNNKVYINKANTNK
ncbi:FecR family protein [Sphingobacterium tabacisoli]|uniref:FecR family protein n=1 Tax=Sphingobacterium tabacisoli TaxID=2044855 RepID=A0ABW5L3I9_9SPHI|nr:FecR family protein [Sphingobacterium tabacisoli]